MGGACVSSSWSYHGWHAWLLGFIPSFLLNVGSPQVSHLLLYIYMYIYTVLLFLSLWQKNSFGASFKNNHQQSVGCLYLFFLWLNEILKYGVFLEIKLGFSTSLGGHVCVCILRLIIWWHAWSLGLHSFFIVNVGSPQVSCLLMWESIYIYIYIYREKKHNTSVSVSLTKK